MAPPKATPKSTDGSAKPIDGSTTKSTDDSAKFTDGSTTKSSDDSAKSTDGSTTKPTDGSTTNATDGSATPRQAPIPSVVTAQSPTVENLESWGSSISRLYVSLDILHGSVPLIMSQGNRTSSFEYSYWYN